jgi:hypothetical protein
LEAPSSLDLAAAARVAKRVELREIRLSEISASNLAPYHGPLHPEVTHTCAPTTHEDHSIEVLCSYDFVVKSNGDDVAKAQFKYIISYDVVGDDAVDEDDLQHFAYANGTYHSWPFVRQLAFDLTARMGYPPYTLPVFQFNPKPKEAAPVPENEDDATPAHEEFREEEGAPSET